MANTIFEGGFYSNSDSTVSGSLNISGSLDVVGINVHSVTITASGSVDLLSISSGSQSIIAVSSSGVMYLGTYNTPPTPISGGLYFDGTDYYLGF